MVWISLCRRFVDSREMAEAFPYRTKALFAFEEIDGVDVCFFGMHVQEYGWDCPPPNTRSCFASFQRKEGFWLFRLNLGCLILLLSIVLPACLGGHKA